VSGKFGQKEDTGKVPKAQKKSGGSDAILLLEDVPKTNT
jgi:hypothetical protein